MFQEYQSENVMMLCIGAAQTQEEAQDWRERFGLTCPILFDPGNQVSRLFWTSAVPYNVVLDSTMTVTYSVAGFAENQVRTQLNNNTAPLIKIDHTSLLNTENNTSPYPINCAIRTPANLIAGTLLIYYNTDGGSSFSSSPLSGSGESYSGTIPAQAWGTTVYYYLHAEADNSQTRNNPYNAPDALHSFQVLHDTTPPSIVHDPITRWRYDQWSPVLSAEVTDELPLASVSVEYQINGGSAFADALTLAQENDYTGSFSQQVALGDVVTYRIKALDTATAQHTSYSPASGYNSMTIIEPIPAMVIDLDGNANSGPAIQAALNGIGQTVEYGVGIPRFPNYYLSVWICLGVAPNNHTMSKDEANVLYDYLINNQGNAYMEGGNIWGDDPGNSFKNEFGVKSDGTGDADTGTIIGEAGTFTEGMTFQYTGDNQSMDHLMTRGNAKRIFSNVSPEYKNAFSNDSGTHKTICSSFEFGGLVDATSPSTKSDLIQAYAAYFGLPTGPTPTPTPTPTPPPSCTDTGAKLYMPDHYFTPGSPCSCSVTLCNPTSSAVPNIPLFVVLEVYGSYYFWPGFTTDMDFQIITLDPGESETTILPEFPWPNAGTADGLVWYAAMTNPTMTELFGSFDSWAFGWGE
jgi:hypothetical protein